MSGPYLTIQKKRTDMECHEKPPAAADTRHPPRYLLLLLLLLALPAWGLAQGSVGSECSAALRSLPQGSELQALPPDAQVQVTTSRALYEEGVRFEQMSTSEMLQFSLRLKANTAKAQQLVALISHGACLQTCLQSRNTCKDNCPPQTGLLCQCCLRCNLALDICATNCLLQQHVAAKPQGPPPPSKGQRTRR